MQSAFAEALGRVSDCTRASAHRTLEHPEANIWDCLRETAQGQVEIDLEALRKAPPLRTPAAHADEGAIGPREAHDRCRRALEILTKRY